MIRFERMGNHLRRIVAGAEMFDQEGRKKILARAEALWWEMRRARKRQALSELEARRQ